MIRAIQVSELPVTEEWLAELSTDRYRPMLRLLDEDDWRFLRRQRGFRPEMEKTLRRQRAQIFQSYLAMLAVDFRRLCAGLRQTGADDLAMRQAEFTARMLLVRARLALYQVGVGRVDASGLVGLFDKAWAELASGNQDWAEVPA